jgi:hypothetical protein
LIFKKKVMKRPKLALLGGTLGGLMALVGAVAVIEDGVENEQHLAGFDVIFIQGRCNLDKPLLLDAVVQNLDTLPPA